MLCPLPEEFAAILGLRFSIFTPLVLLFFKDLYLTKASAAFLFGSHELEKVVPNPSSIELKALLDASFNMEFGSHR